MYIYTPHITTKSLEEHAPNCWQELPREAGVVIQDFQILM